MVHRKAIEYTFLFILLFALAGCAGQAAPAAQPQSADAGPADSKPATTTAAPTAKPTQASAAEAKSGDPKRWQKVKGWQGTFTTDHTEVDVKKTANIGSVIKHETLVNRKITSSGTIVIDEAVEVEEGEYTWGAQEDSETNQSSISIDLKRVTERHENGKLVLIETYTENGSGTATMDWVEGAQLYINAEEGTYSLQISAGQIEVEVTLKVVLPTGDVFTDESDTMLTQESIGGGVADIPLPASGLQLKGSGKTPHGQVITWDLAPIQ